jgi:CRP-like cAMP-binding protein
VQPPSDPPRDPTSEDARWLRQVGQRRPVKAGEEVIRAGQAPEYLFVVLEGEFVIPADASRPEQRLGPGTLLWEMAYMRRIPPERSIYAVSDSVLLCLRPSDVDARVRDDPSFGERLLRMLSDFALEHVAGGAPVPPAGPEPPPRRDLPVPEMIKKLLRGEFE